MHQPCMGAVFPAYAGMFLFIRLRGGGPQCFPRIRGDVPSVTIEALEYLEFSPHTRGCSGYPNRLDAAGTVFPAYAGMFRREEDSSALMLGFPRIRGDVPR